MNTEWINSLDNGPKLLVVYNEFLKETIEKEILELRGQEFLNDCAFVIPTNGRDGIKIFDSKNHPNPDRIVKNNVKTYICPSTLELRGNGYN